MRFHNKDLVEKAYSEGTKSKDAFAMSLPVVDEGEQLSEQPGTIETVVDAKTSSEMTQASTAAAAVPTKIELAKQQGYTGSMCGGCGSFKLKRNGSCEVCMDCGATSGCS